MTRKDVAVAETAEKFQEEQSQVTREGQPGEPEVEFEERSQIEIGSLKHQMSANLQAVAELRAQVSEFDRMVRDRLPVPSTDIEGIYATMISDIYCPECGLKLDDSARMGKVQYYLHPFAPAARLGGAQCILKGQKFLAPRIFLPRMR